MGIMDLLREETAGLHDRAEKHPFQRALVQGRVARGAYAAYLRQMLHVHQALEGELEASRGVWPISEVVTREQFREGGILEDLAALGEDGGEVLDGARTLAGEIRARRGEALHLLGMQYVLEGSTNGGRYIARAIARAYGLTPGEAGLRYLDPYGERQQKAWGAFKGAMSGLDLDEASRVAILGGARAMFEGVTLVLESLGEAWLEETPIVEVPGERAKV